MRGVGPLWYNGPMFEGFHLAQIDTGEAVLRVRIGGSGPPLLLLHGHPQTHVMWHKVAPRLAERFTVVAPDLRGYGDSSKPPTTPDHAPYAKRAMARDAVALMAHLGYSRFAVAGHDRGGATIDYAHDEADRGRRRIACPVLALWAGRGELAKWYDVLAIWRDWAADVQGQALDCGHYLAEEAPDAVATALAAFFAE